ncbi:MAG TPA: TolC family protein [Pyrinomonadaceae bacterium]|nr:TolC family protein [Pyrinomonadaceae bacterium]
MPGFIRTKIISVIAVMLLAAAGSTASAQEPLVIPPGVEVISLDKAIDLALLNNRSAKNARLEVDKSDDRTAAARTHMLPVFKFNAGVSKPLSTFDTTFEAGVFGPVPTEDTVITSTTDPTAAIVGQIQQPLSQLHRIKLQIKQQEMATEISRAQLSATEQSLVNEVKRAYYAILQSQGAAQAAEANIKLYRELDRVTGEYVVQQVVLKTEHMDVQTRVAKAEYDLMSIQNQLLAQKEQLNHLLGRDVRTEFAVSSADETALAVMRETDLVSARERALANRPELREARLRIGQAKLDKRIKKSEFIPDVSLTVNYATTFSYSNFVPRSLSGVGVQVEWEVFDWGRKKREVAEREKSITEANNSLADVESQIVMEVHTRFRQMQETRQMLKVAKLAQTQARANVQMVTYKYRLDAVLLKDVLQAQTVLANSDYDYQKALLAFWTAKADFEKAIGEEK